MLKWTIRMIEVEAWIVRVVSLRNEGASTQVRVSGDLSDEFSVNDFVH